MKFLLLGILIVFGSSAQSRTIDCYDIDGRWTHMRIENAGSRSATFRILDANRESAENEIGGVAALKLRKVVHPGGEAFFHYKGIFNPEFRQKTISLYLSGDLSTLRFLWNDGPYDVACLLISHKR